MSLNNDNSIYGLNIYEDKKGRIIYKDFLMKNAVYIPTFDFKMFSFYRYRYIIGVSSFIVLQTLFTLFHASVLLSNILTIFIFVFFFQYCQRKAIIPRESTHYNFFRT